tara:strand:+ start:96711 stop:97211 length:501 start_codon:yes stop_codon:yes gene_type:complete
MSQPADQSSKHTQPSTDANYKRPRPLKRRNVLARSSRFGPNMTPMVDVTLVILIFFMASASIGGLEWFLQAELPKNQDPDLQSSGYSLPTPMIHADLFLQNRTVMVRGFGDQPSTIDVVVDRIKGMDPSDAKGFILGIRAQDDVPYEAIVLLHDAASLMEMRVAIR